MTDNEKQQIKREILITHRAQMISEMCELYKQIADSIRLTDRDIADGELTRYNKECAVRALAHLELYPEMKDMFPDEIQHLNDNLAKGDKHEDKNESNWL